ncbi:RNA-binding domain-containing protein-containing protein [Dipodascopsis tothii]|uniref:RNA-binding domain-containing protein-containing protein n=1 Tax=Dipodascopsis tothii TaxID=44089 RepID=UPI0034CE050E
MSGTPSQTLYVNNLNDKIRKQDLRLSLYTLFSTYGQVMAVIALKTQKMRGQAHVVFTDTASAMQAMRALQGFTFLGKELRIAFATSKSHDVAKLDGTFRLPVFQTTADDAPKGVKRPREDDDAE